MKSKLFVKRMNKKLQTLKKKLEFLTITVAEFMNFQTWKHSINMQKIINSNITSLCILNAERC